MSASPELEDIVHALLSSEGPESSPMDLGDANSCGKRKRVSGRTSNVQKFDSSDASTTLVKRRKKEEIPTPLSPTSASSLPLSCSTPSVSLRKLLQESR
tara:strand:+ start:364 stop:660 length:297 start_codon:yes stop_codon:yes gene_type:complete